MTIPSKPRIESLDLLKGLVMVIMALDHTRDYFHYSAFFFDPTDPEKTTLPIFFTRWITHFCAPSFSLLAGISAYLVGQKKTASELSGFLLKRGIWLIFVELVIVSYGWKFDPNFTNTGLQVIWVLGMSMIVLAALIHLPNKLILLFSCMLIFGHNLLDGFHFDGSFLWAVLHERHNFEWAPGHFVTTAYSLLPWVGVMSLGYCVGSLYDSTFDNIKRRKILAGLGWGSLALFIILLAFNNYGNPEPWINYGANSKTLMSMLDVNKYPPSLWFLLITLGSAMLFLSKTESVKGKIVNFFSVFGRVPFFYYIIHIYLIHLLALFAAEFSGFGWQSMILPKFVTRVEALQGYGFNLITVYVVWGSVVLVLYPLCAKFDRYKQSNKDKWWLSYL